MWERLCGATLQTTGHGSLHDPIGLIFGNAREAGGPFEGAAVLDEFDEMAFKAMCEAASRL